MCVCLYIYMYMYMFTRLCTYLAVVLCGDILYSTEAQLWSHVGICSSTLVVQVTEILRGNCMHVAETERFYLKSVNVYIIDRVWVYVCSVGKNHQIVWSLLVTAVPHSTPPVPCSTLPIRSHREGEKVNDDGISTLHQCCTCVRSCTL